MKKTTIRLILAGLFLIASGQLHSSLTVDIHVGLGATPESNATKRLHNVSGWLKQPWPSHKSSHK